MTIYWVHSDSDDALTLMAAVERALETGDTGTPPPPGVAASPATSGNPTDTYLHDNMAIARAVWSSTPTVLSCRADRDWRRRSTPFSAWCAERHGGTPCRVCLNLGALGSEGMLVR